MSGPSVQIKIKINFPVILLIVLCLHALFLAWRGVSDLNFAKAEPKKEQRTPLNIRQIRTVGARDSKTRNNAYLSKNDSLTKIINKEIVSKFKNPSKSLSLSDLTPPMSKPAQPSKEQSARPGTRPEPARAKAISGISLQGHQMRQFAQGSSSSASGGDAQSASLSNSDIAVNLEVPEGVSPDELNKYELMFYGFQRRTAINYINAFYKNLDKFQRANPHLTFPMTENKQVMTGRLTYDENGNIKQIKMVRWSNVDRLQEFFVDVLKEMNTLQNPPHALWEQTGEFSIFFSFVVNG